VTGDVLEDIVSLCADACGVTVAEMQSRSRRAPVAAARHMAVCAAIGNGFTFSAIAHELERDESTIRYYARDA
jgi:DNA-binding NarL/FixJ family response regulator